VQQAVVSDCHRGDSRFLAPCGCRPCPRLSRRQLTGLFQSSGRSVARDLGGVVDAANNPTLSDVTASRYRYRYRYRISNIEYRISNIEYRISVPIPESVSRDAQCDSTATRLCLTARGLRRDVATLDSNYQEPGPCRGSANIVGAFGIRSVRTSTSFCGSKLILSPFTRPGHSTIAVVNRQLDHAGLRGSATDLLPGRRVSTLICTAAAQFVGAAVRQRITGDADFSTPPVVLRLSGVIRILLFQDPQRPRSQPN
jgi:hypothetical protein